MIEGKLYYGSRVDVWSSGVILFAMVAGYLPFEDKDTGKLYQKILSGEFQMPKHLSNECKDILKKVLETDPDKRLTTAQIK
jgi:5'-AMP-activated protein kinase catalytic alpha subunit